jgi:N-formylglutamate amidohydrolase
LIKYNAQNLHTAPPDKSSRPSPVKYGFWCKQESLNQISLAAAISISPIQLSCLMAILREEEIAMNSAPFYEIIEAHSPLVATAIHGGHDVREEVAKRLALSDGDRLREEDPHTGVWTQCAKTRIVVHRSRFEVDLNRPRGMAVYIKPEDSWGLRTWKRRPPQELVQRSLAEYDNFYTQAAKLFSKIQADFGGFVVFDLHTYNHRRDGSTAPPEKPEANPEVNIGTGTMDRNRWAPVVDQLISNLRDFDFLGRHLDVRENVKFRGGQLPRWLHESFPGTACALAIEFKKFFMDEWSGELDTLQHRTIARALESTTSDILDTMKGLV